MFVGMTVHMMDDFVMNLSKCQCISCCLGSKMKRVAHCMMGHKLNVKHCHGQKCTCDMIVAWQLIDTFTCLEENMICSINAIS